MLVLLREIWMPLHCPNCELETGAYSPPCSQWTPALGGDARPWQFVRLMQLLLHDQQVLPSTEEV